MEAPRARKYDHDSFLEQSTFASYKELIYRESSTQKQSTDSTSAESPKRFRSIEDKEFQSKDSLEADPDSRPL